jgi:hypothetical protein
MKTETLQQTGYKDGLNGVYNNPNPNPEPQQYTAFMEYHNANNNGQWTRRTATALIEKLKEQIIERQTTDQKKQFKPL